MIRSAWPLVLALLVACQSPDYPDIRQTPVVNGQWRYVSEDGDKGEDLDLNATGAYSRTKWFADLVHEEHGQYEVQASRYPPEGWLILFYPAPETVTDAIWQKNPYGYHFTELGDTTLGLMISSRVNPTPSESIIGETIQIYHPRP